MIVACQWNCKKQACQFYGYIELVDDIARGLVAGERKDLR